MRYEIKIKYYFFLCVRRISLFSENTFLRIFNLLFPDIITFGLKWITEKIIKIFHMDIIDNRYFLYKWHFDLCWSI